MPPDEEMPTPDSESAIVSRREIFAASVTSAQREQLSEIRRTAGARSVSWEHENDKWVLVTTWEAFL